VTIEEKILKWPFTELGNNWGRYNEAPFSKEEVKKLVEKYSDYLNKLLK
jgi:hypothetical protein